MGLVQSMFFRPLSTTPLEDAAPIPSKEDIFNVISAGNANRLSELFDNYAFSLTMIDDDAQTLLHLAVSL